VLELAEIERLAERPLAVAPALEQLLAGDPWDEAAHRALIAALAAAGRPTEATQQYERCRALLRDELGTEPEPETSALAERIRSVAASSTAAPHRLTPTPVPTPPTPLVGRAPDVAAVSDLLQRADVRLVTILGPGGMGKTRLALEVARGLREGFGDGVAWVPLAAVRDTALVVPAIARALGIDDRAGPPVAERLRDALYEREVLIVLDNLEHLIGAAVDVATLLEGSPGTRVLATSRAPLQIRAERQYPLGAFSLPAGAPVSASEAADHEAVALFVDRVRAVDATFRLTDANAGTVAAICARLDGLPLALELAAARCRHLPPDALLRKLDRRMAVLVGGARDLPDRLRTMHAAIEWSHELLGAHEQAAFRRLAPFVGGASMEAVAAVLAAPGLSESGDPGALVATLADQSLVRYEPAGSERLAMLETIREYAGERLVASGEAETVAWAHADHYLHWIDSIAGRLHGPELPALLEAVERDHGNLRAAWATLIELDDPEPVLRLAGAMGPFWRLRGHTSEGRQRLGLALASPGGSPLVRARALVQAADLAHPQGDVEPAEAMYREALTAFEAAGDQVGIGQASQGLAALEIGRTAFDAAAAWAERARHAFEQLGQPRGMAYALNSLATVAFWRGRLDEAGDLWTRCVALLAETGDDRARGIALSNMGVVALELGDHAAALAHHREALAIARTIGGPAAVTHPLLNIGRVMVLAGDHSGARVALHEALENARLLGDVARQSAALQTLSQSALLEDDVPAAAGHLAASIDLVRRSGSGILAAATLEAAAAVVRRAGDSVAAARLLGAAESGWAAIGGSREAADQPAWEEDVQALRSSLAPEAFDAAWAAGVDLTSQAALDEAQQLLARVRPAGPLTGS
jgi:predicted ATPase